MLYVFRIFISAFTGIIAGIIGIIVWVFSGAGSNGMLAAVAAASAVYLLLSLLTGFLFPDYGWKWGIITSAAGIVLLGIYELTEYDPLTLILILAIFGFSCLGAWGGSSAGNYIQLKKARKIPVSRKR